MKYLILLLILMLFLSGCEEDTSVDPDNSAWLIDLINQLQSQPVQDPPAAIFQYEYKGDLVYYLPPACCDQYSTLYDKEGNIICLPDGGITGTGDGLCPDFFAERKNERLIWRDPRG